MYVSIFVFSGKCKYLENVPQARALLTGCSDLANAKQICYNVWKMKEYLFQFGTMPVNKCSVSEDREILNNLSHTKWKK